MSSILFPFQISGSDSSHPDSGNPDPNHRRYPPSSSSSSSSSSSTHIASTETPGPTPPDLTQLLDQILDMVTNGRPRIDPRDTLPPPPGQFLVGRDKNLPSTSTTSTTKPDTNLNTLLFEIARTESKRKNHPHKHHHGAAHHLWRAFSIATLLIVPDMALLNPKGCHYQEKELLYENEIAHEAKEEMAVAGTADEEVRSVHKRHRMSPSSGDVFDVERGRQDRHSDVQNPLGPEPGVASPTETWLTITPRGSQDMEDRPEVIWD
ncbi:hypothetical protein QBC35DRAFT_552353 [Podospora australis]|uniref:Uncharacterized protein n=1 Tax=Podospora australis TaxID=1536484 RepID=A0AAN6WSH3_9PEZI|nr:hypothetical protein QBC35DRAFT_552353 [Podospora australis]